MNIDKQKKKMLDWFCHLELREDSLCQFIDHCNTKCYEYNQLEKMIDKLIVEVAYSADSMQVNAMPNVSVYTPERIRGYNDHCRTIQEWKKKIQDELA